MRLKLCLTNNVREWDGRCTFCLFVKEYKGLPQSSAAGAAPYSAMLLWANLIISVASEQHRPKMIGSCGNALIQLKGIWRCAVCIHVNVRALRTANLRLTLTRSTMRTTYTTDLDLPAVRDWRLCIVNAFGFISASFKALKTLPLKSDIVSQTHTKIKRNKATPKILNQEKQGIDRILLTWCILSNQCIRTAGYVVVVIDVVAERRCVDGRHRNSENVSAHNWVRIHYWTWRISDNRPTSWHRTNATVASIQCSVTHLATTPFAPRSVCSIRLPANQHASLYCTYTTTTHNSPAQVVSVWRDKQCRFVVQPQFGDSGGGETNWGCSCCGLRMLLASSPFARIYVTCSPDYHSFDVHFTQIYMSVTQIHKY